MRDIFTLLLFILLGSKSVSQTIEKLDERNGFKTIKLGSDISEYDSMKLTIVSGEIDKNLIRYYYSIDDQDLKKVFDVKFDAIYLVFKDKKLVGIELRKKFTSSYHYQTAFEELKPIISNFRELFGQNTSSTSEESGQLGCIWAGQKVLLQAITNRIGLKEGSENKVDVYDIKFVDKRTNQGF